MKNGFPSRKQSGAHKPGHFECSYCHEWKAIELRHKGRGLVCKTCHNREVQLSKLRRKIKLTGETT